MVHRIQDMHSANRSLGYLVNCFDALFAIKAEISKPIISLSSKREFIKNQEYFEISYKLAAESLGHYPKIQESLSQDASYWYIYFENINSSLAKGTFAKDKKELLDEAARIESRIRDHFINIKYESDRTFYNIYSNRYVPLIVITIVSLLFLGYLHYYANSLFTILKKSIHNLLYSIDVVAKGNFHHQANVITDDEVGVVTKAFNSMVQKLATAKQDVLNTTGHLTILQKITGAFSRAVTNDEVYDIIIETVFNELQVDSGYIALYNKDNKLSYPHILKSTGKELSHCQKHTQETFQKAIDEKRGIFLDNETTDCAFIPLLIAGRPIGLIAMEFKHKLAFSESRKQLILAAIRQCAQALYRTQLYENAQEAIKTRDDFLSIASHELKTPLTPLKLVIQSLKRRLDSSNDMPLTKEDILKAVITSDKQISRLNHLIEDLLDVSRIESGKFILSKDNVNLSELITEVVKNYKTHLDRSDIEIKFFLDENLKANVDPIRVEQVLINFITNAGKYARGKPIKIELQKNSEEAVISVSDHGPGIKDEDQKRIFERFERVKDDQNIGGLGLGLYISKQIVEAHNGKICVQSQVGKGSTFSASFPINI